MFFLPYLLFQCTVFSRVYSSPTSYSCLENCRCDNYEATKYYVGCEGPPQEENFASLPKNVTMVKMENKIIPIIKAKMLNRFSNLTDLLLGALEIEFIEEQAFRSTTKLGRINLEDNLLESFPWSSLSYLPKLKYLNLRSNRLVTLPGWSVPSAVFARSDRAAAALRLDLTRNARVTCSCETIEFARKLALHRGVRVDRWQDIECRTGHVIKKLGNVSESDCATPNVNVAVELLDRDDDGGLGSWTVMGDNASVYLNASANIGCVASGGNLYRSRLTLELFGSEFVMGKSAAVATSAALPPTSYVRIDPTTMMMTIERDSGSRHPIVCALDDSNATYTSRVFVELPQKEPEISTSSIPVVNTSVTSSFDLLSTTQPTQEASTRGGDEVKFTTHYNERCGVETDFSMALIRSVLTNKTSFTYQLDDLLTVFLSLHEEHRAVDVEFVRTGIVNRELTICHTFGPRMLRVKLRKRQKRQLYSIMINSYNPKFIVCVVLPGIKRGVCGEFIVHNTAARSSLFVMFIVGGFLLGLGVVPLAVATSYHVWDKRQQRARGGRPPYDRGEATAASEHSDNNGGGDQCKQY